MVPIVIVCFNNHKYVENSVRQITAKNPKYASQIIIMDNASDNPETIQYLDTTPHRVFRNTTNQGPWINCYYNTNVFETLPNRFILTDPDLEYNKDLPENFIEDMIEVMDTTEAWMVGFALRIDDSNDMINPDRVLSFEKKFWEKRIEHPKYELYDADIDTTFALRDYSSKIERFVRMAGNFTARHLPWYKNDGVLTDDDKRSVFGKNPLNISYYGEDVLSYISKLPHAGLEPATLELKAPCSTN